MTKPLTHEVKTARKIARFLDRVAKTEDCWLWLGYKSATGYGRTGRQWAHRRAYELMVGPIPGGMEIDHLCRNRGCVNPAHMEVVTHQENQRRGNSPCGLNARKTHCKHGHEFSEANTYISGDGKRGCRACHANTERRRRVKLAGVVALVALVLPSVAQAHFKPGLHNRRHAIVHAFCGSLKPCPLGNEALNVAYCESGPNLWPYAQNGQYWGMFQFGSWARSTFGFGWGPWEQARAARRYWQHSGWSGWSCRP